MSLSYLSVRMTCISMCPSSFVEAYEHTAVRVCVRVCVRACVCIVCTRVCVSCTSVSRVCIVRFRLKLQSNRKC